MKYITKLRKYCNDFHKIENYESAQRDNFKGWVLHHRLEISLDGQEVHTPATLERLNMYWHRPYFELIFMKRGDHIILHNKSKGHLTESRRKKISDSVKQAHKDPNIAAKYAVNRYKFPKGNYFGK